jgi:ubiquinone biosynthesis protein COQ4
MDLAEFSRFAQQLTPTDSLRVGQGDAVPSDSALHEQFTAFVADRERHHQLPLVHPDRQPMRFDWLGALRHFRQLGSDKDRTDIAFQVFEALPWIGVSDAACAFLGTSQGRAIYASEPNLLDILDDHAALRRLPKGSFGQEYCDHMQRDGMTAVGLVADFEAARGAKPRLDDRVEWYLDRLRDTHDLLHVLTGFGRDVLGEQCVLTFVFEQRPSIGHLFVGYAGAALTRLNSPWNVPVLRAVLEARKIGKGCLPVAEQPIRELLAMPIDDVRERLGLRPARYYPEAMRIFRELGVDPNLVLAKAAVA